MLRSIFSAEPPPQGPFPCPGRRNRSNRSSSSSSSTSGISVSNRIDLLHASSAAHPRQQLATPCPYPPVLPTGSTTLVTLVPARARRDRVPGYPCEAHTSAAVVPQRPAATDLELSSGSRLVFVPASRPPRSRHQQMLLLGAGARHQLPGRGRMPQNSGSLSRVEGAECRMQTALRAECCRQLSTCAAPYLPTGSMSFREIETPREAGQPPRPARGTHTHTHILRTSIHTHIPAQITWCLICITSCQHWSDIDTSGSTSTTHIDTPRRILSHVAVFLRRLSPLLLQAVPGILLLCPSPSGQTSHQPSVPCQPSCHFFLTNLPPNPILLTSCIRLFFLSHSQPSLPILPTAALLCLPLTARLVCPPTPFSYHPCWHIELIASRLLSVISICA